MIDVYDDIDTTTINIAGAYSQKLMGYFVVVKLEGHIVDLMIMINPEKYAKHIHYEGYKKVRH